MSVLSFCDPIYLYTLVPMQCWRIMRQICRALYRYKLTSAPSISEVEGVTRKERFSSSSPIEDTKGPVLAADCEHICGS